MQHFRLLNSFSYSSLILNNPSSSMYGGSLLYPVTIGSFFGCLDLLQNCV